MSERVEGQLQGLKASQRAALERTFRRRVPPALVATNELLRHMLEISQDMNRRVGVLLDRRGHVQAVAVGDHKRVYLPEIGRLRAAAYRLRGVRWLVTQLRHAEPIHRDDLVDLQKLRLDYLLQVARAPSGQFVLQGAHLMPDDEEGIRLERSDSVDALSHGDFLEFVTQLEAELGKDTPQARTRHAGKGNSAVIVVVGTAGKRDLDSRADEMRELCATAGVEVADVVLQTRARLDPNYVIGHGKLEDVVLGALRLDADTLIFDRELSPAQVRSIADATELKVIDRTQLILDIFAQHAKTVDGKLQVELAQLKYNLPRLSEMSTAMSRLTGGIGGRGPGETKLEINRRRAKERITELERAIDAVSSERGLRRRRRMRAGVPIISLVGYTNAGKSTLLNALTQSDVLVENKLFATLDPTSRRMRFPAAREVIITDTVGFIRELPEELKKAFRATLEELFDANLLVHVVDASDPERLAKTRAVEQILRDMGLGHKPTILAWNKADRTDLLLGKQRGGHVVVSAKKRAGLDALLAEMEARLDERRDEEHA